jgi:hypothetical protein
MVGGRSYYAHFLSLLTITTILDRRSIPWTGKERRWAEAETNGVEQRDVTMVVFNILR